MNIEKIIEVDNTHRIKLTRYFNGNYWMWELQKQKFYRSAFSFKKKWHNSSWNDDRGEFFITVKSYYNEEDAMRAANYLKKALSNG